MRHDGGRARRLAAAGAGTVAAVAAGAMLLLPGSAGAATPGGDVSVTKTLNQSVTGTGHCSFSATVSWGDGAVSHYTYTSPTRFSHTYTRVGAFPIRVTGTGTPQDGQSTCTFHPYSENFVVAPPAVKQPLSRAAQHLPRAGADGTCPTASPCYDPNSGEIRINPTSGAAAANTVGGI